MTLKVSLAGILTLPHAALADSELRTSAVVSTSAGWSSNPFAEPGNDRSSASVQVDVRPAINWVNEHDVLSLTGVLTYQHFFRNYSDSNDYGGGLDYFRTVNSRLTAHVAAHYDSSIIGGFDAITPVTNPALPVPPVTTGPDLALVGTRDRRTLLSFAGDVGYSLSAYDSLTANAFYNQARYGRFETASRYNSYGGGLGYSRRLTERLQLGAQASTSRYDYQGLFGKSQVYSLQATFRDRFTDRWTASGAVGVSFSNQSLGSRSTNLTGNLQLCRVGTRATLCITGNDAVLPTGGSGTVNSKAVGASYVYHLSERSVLSFAADYSRNDQPIDNRFANGFSIASSYVTGSVNFDRQLRQRLHFVATTHYRRIINSFNGSPTDFGGTVGLSIRIGDLR